MIDKLCLTVVVLDRAKTPAQAIREKQGKKIRDFRQFREQSQAVLAESIGVTKAAVSDWENGNSSPRQHLQVAIAKQLGVPWSSIFGLDGEVA